LFDCAKPNFYWKQSETRACGEGHVVGQAKERAASSMDQKLLMHNAHPSELAAHPRILAARSKMRVAWVEQRSTIKTTKSFFC
jgi:hypothetical protein